MTKKCTDHVKRKNIGWINQKGKYFLAANISHKTYKPVTVRKNSNIYRIHKHIKKDVSYVHRRISFHCGSSISYNYPFWFIIYGIYFCFCCCSSFFNPKIFLLTIDLMTYNPLRFALAIPNDSSISLLHSSADRK